MLKLSSLEAFHGLTHAELGALEAGVDRRMLPAGQVVCRRGEAGVALYVIESGAVAVELVGEDGRAARHVYLGPGQMFGEMSLLSGEAVSATVQTVHDTWFAMLRKDRFEAACRQHPSLLAPFLRLLIERLRHRSNPATAAAEGNVIVAIANREVPLAEFARLLARLITIYAPDSCTLIADDATPGPAADSSASGQWPGELGEAPADWRWRGTGSSAALSPVLSVSAPSAWWAACQAHWRAGGHLGRYLLIVIHEAGAAEACDRLGAGDAILMPADMPEGEARRLSGLAATARYRVAKGREAGTSDNGWYHCLPPHAFESEGHETVTPGLGALARWLTRREVGVAMGSGAALGFAHLGVMQVLEDAGIPIDYVCGTSMGGAVALVYARTASMSEAIALARDLAGSNRRVVDLSWVPRSSMLSGRKVRRSVEAAFGEIRFDQLERPCAVVAADLVGRQRIVFDSGPVSPALRATIAIPGLFPPVHHEGRILVDGALVSRIPVNLLARRRCGLKIAVNVIPSLGRDEGGTRARLADLTQRVQRVLGLRHVIGESWEMLGWWHGALEAQAADVLIEPATKAGSGYDFGAIDRLIESGRLAAQAKLPAIRQAAEAMLKPGVP